MQDLSGLEEIIGYHFKDTKNIQTALVHPGSLKTSRPSSKEFERLEFLGDRVLGLSLAGLIYEKFPNESEGELAIRIASLAGTDFLIELAKKKKLIHFFIVPQDMFLSKNKTSSSIADMMEAIVGSVFLDGGFERAQRLIADLWGEDLDKVVYKKKDPKTRLQEFAQKGGGDLPVYRLVKMTGEAHDPVFEMEVSACGETAHGFGNSKKDAEHDAAEKLVTKILK